MANFYRRTFLNKPGFHSVASVYAKVDDGCNYPTLIISDCSRQISLDVSIEEDDDRDNTLHKLDVLVRTLRDFRKAVYDKAGLIPPRL